MMRGSALVGVRILGEVGRSEELQLVVVPGLGLGDDRTEVRLVLDDGNVRAVQRVSQPVGDKDFAFVELAVQIVEVGYRTEETMAHDSVSLKRWIFQIEIIKQVT